MKAKKLWGGVCAFVMLLASLIPTVAPAAPVAGADGSAGYLWLHFEATDYEKIYYGYSADGVTWNKLNNNQPLITSEVANKGIRDPHIIRLEQPDADGNRYVMLGTDLHAEGSAGGKSWSQESKNLIGSRSKDLVNWTEAEAVFAGWDDANRAWAPEAIYDEAKGAYMVYWSSKPDSVQSTPLGVYRSYTTDFKTFTKPERWIDESSVNNGNIIDTTIVKGEDGNYYRFSTSDWYTVIDCSPTLNAEHWTRLVDRASAVNADGTSKIAEYQTANNPAQGDQKIATTEAMGLNGIEGLTVFQNPDGTWRIMGDNQGYRAFDIAKLSDLKSGVAPTRGTSNFPLRFRHGTVMALTAEEQQSVLAAYGDLVTPIEPDEAGSEPIASYDFSDGTASDGSGNGYNLTLNNGAKVEAYGDRANNMALSLRAGTQFAEFPTGMFDGRNEFTLEFSSKSRASSGNFFTFAIGRDSGKYLFIRLRGGEASVAITTGSWQAEYKIAANIDTAAWHDYTLSVDGNHIALYVDDVLAGEVDTNVSISDFGKGTKAYFGKSFYPGDAYFDGAIDDVRVYNWAKSEFDVVGMGAALKVADTDQVLSQKGETNEDGSVSKTIVLDYWSDAKTGIKSDPANVSFEYEIPEGVTVADANGAQLTVEDLNAVKDYSSPLELKLTYDGKTVDYAVGIEVLNTPIRISGDEGAASGVGETDPTGAEGWKFFADPQVVAWGGKYYIFPTTDGYADWKGHSIHAFESTDLVNWTDKGVVVDLAKDYDQMPDGRTEKAWAPGFAERDGKFYLYFSGNGQVNVAISDPAKGGTITSGYEIQKVKVESSIDPAIFQDPATGKWYMAWGQAPGKYAELTDDMTGIKPGTLVETYATKDMREASYITSRPDPNNPGNNIYYYSYSIDDTNSPNYRVAYAWVSAKSLDEATGADWQYGKDILSRDDAKGILGTAHHSLLQVPGTDDWYIVYHAFLTDEMRPRGYDSTHGGVQIRTGNKREVRIGRLTYDENGQMNVVPVTYEGVLPETTPVASLSVTEDGTPRVGDTLEVTFNEGWKAVEAQWYRNGEPIEGATGVSYTLVNEDAGATISAKAVGESTTGVKQNAQAWEDAPLSRTFELEAGDVKVSEEIPAPVVDKSDLKAEILECEKLDEFAYTAKSWAAFVVALDDARTVVASDTATQDDVDNALKALETARAGLEKADPEPTPDPDPDPEKPNGDQGGKKDEEVPNTGDPTLLAGVPAAFGAGAMALGVVLSRRRK